MKHLQLVGLVLHHHLLGLDAALHRTVRKVRVGTAKTGAWTITNFKTSICSELSYSFSCAANLRCNEPYN